MPMRHTSNWIGWAAAGAILWVIASQPVSAAPCTVECTPPDNLACTCSAGSGDCEISNAQVVDPGAVIDCGTRNIRLKDNGGRIEVTDGFVTVRAHDLRIDSNHRILALRRDLPAPQVPFGIIIELSGTLDAPGLIIANSNTGGGSIRIDTDGDILLSEGGGSGNGIEARGTAANAPGGHITLSSARHAVIDEPIVADTEAGSGGVANGGTVAVTAAGNLMVRAKIDVFGRQDQAGSIRLTAQGTVDANGNPVAAPPPCGHWNQTGNLWIGVNGPLLAEGGNINGHGGEIELAGRTITVLDRLSAQGGLNVGGGLSEGGSVQLEAGDCGVSINADINVTSGEGGAGEDSGAIVVESDGNLSVGAGVQLVTKSDANGGDGGAILLASNATLSIGDGALLDARGDMTGGDHGVGAAIRLTGCAVSVAADAMLDASGYSGGTVHLAGTTSVSIGDGVQIFATGTALSRNGSIAFASAPNFCAAHPEEECTVAADCSLVCTPGTCLAGGPPGICSNDPNRTCSTNPQCTVGCQTGECLLGTCSNAPFVRCNQDAACQNLGCQSDVCAQRIVTAPTAQMNPTASAGADTALGACN